VRDCKENRNCLKDSRNYILREVSLQSARISDLMTRPLYIFAIANLSLAAPCKHITHGFVSFYYFHLEKKVRYEVSQVENVKLSPRFVKGKAFNLHSQTTRDA